MQPWWAKEAYFNNISYNTQNLLLTIVVKRMVKCVNLNWQYYTPSDNQKKPTYLINKHGGGG